MNLIRTHLMMTTWNLAHFGRLKRFSQLQKKRRLMRLAYCLGGTLLASLLGYLVSADDQENFIDSATFLTTMVDFSVPGDLGVFVDEKKRIAA